MSYQSVVVADSPASFYWLNDTNTTAVDLQSVQNGSYSGTYTQSQPTLINKGNGSTQFDGASGSVAVSNNANQQPGSGSWSVEIWFNPLAVSGTQGMIIKDLSSGYSNPPWALQLGNTTVTFAICVSSNTTYSINHNRSVATGHIYHAIGVFDATNNNITIYLNGVVTTNTPTTTTGTIGSPTGAVRIGQQKSGSSRWFNGYLNAGTWYPSALTAAQVKTHWQAGIAAHRFMAFM